MSQFSQAYLGPFLNVPLEILDFGSQDLPGQQDTSYREFFVNEHWSYSGLDLESGPNVDIVLPSAYDWGGLTDERFDVVVSGQTFEHVGYFWVSVLEIARVLKPGGIFFCIAPSAGFEHRYPIDAWRFYRDGFEQLAIWMQFDVLDVYTDWGFETWSDSILVAQKPMWEDSEVATFYARLAHQRAALDPWNYASADTERSSGPISPLAKVGGGKLVPLFEFERARRSKSLRQSMGNYLRKLLGARGAAKLIGIVRRFLP